MLENNKVQKKGVNCRTEKECWISVKKTRSTCPNKIPNTAKQLLRVHCTSRLYDEYQNKLSCLYRNKINHVRRNILCEKLNAAQNQPSSCDWTEGGASLKISKDKDIIQKNSEN